MWGWKFKLNSGIDKNYRVTAAFKASTSVTFEILEVIDDPVFRKLREDGYIKINIGKPLCLNIASDSISNLGIKRNPNRKISKHGCKPVVKIDDLGRVIEKYESVADANRGNNTKDVSECFKNSLRKVKGMMFREVDKDGNIISPPVLPKKQRKSRLGIKLPEHIVEARREVYRLRRLSDDYTPPCTAKALNQYTLSGELVATHKSIMGAARSMGSNLDTFRKAIKKSPTNFTKGFIWKYADAV